MAARLGRAERLAAVPPAVVEVWDRLQAGGETYLVGGAVRDILLGRMPRDYDLATALGPAEAQTLLVWPDGPGGRFGSLHAPGLPLEVVALRAESGYADRRRPDVVRFGVTLERDLARRDFTINALALRRDGRIVDPFGGRRDLRRHRLAAVGDPAARLREDLLRTLRAYRFAAEMGLRISRALRAAAREVAGELSEVAAERVGQEIWRLLEGPDGLRAARAAGRDGVLAAVAPWLRPTRPAEGALVRTLAWSDATQGDVVVAAAERFAWPHAQRRLLEQAVVLRDTVRGTPERARWREALSESGEEAALLLVRAGGGPRLQALSRLFGREGVIDRRRLPLRGQDLARARGVKDKEIGRLEREELLRLFQDPREIL